MIFPKSRYYYLYDVDFRILISFFCVVCELRQGLSASGTPLAFPQVKTWGKARGVRGLSDAIVSAIRFFMS